MKFFYILITILSSIVIYIIFKNYIYNNSIEKFTTECTASLTDWEKTTSRPSSGNQLNTETDLKWDTLKAILSASSENIVSFSFKDDLFSDMNNVLDYKIKMNDYLKINNNEYWKPIKKWKEGVVSHFCKELCVLKLGYEWIKIEEETAKTELKNLSNTIADGGIGETKTDLIRQLIKKTFIIIPPSTYSVSTNEYAKLDTIEFNNIIGSSYVNDNNYIVVDNIYYKVAANMPIGRKWKVENYLSHETDDILHDITQNNVKYFYDLPDVQFGNIIILSESDYNTLFRDNGINLTEKYVIHPGLRGISFKPELFEYDKCYMNSCAVFANKEFDDYLKLINLRESMGYKTSSFGYATEIMNNSDNNLLDLVSKLQKSVNDKKLTTRKCSYTLMMDKLLEVIKIGEYVRQDDSTSEKCTKTYDPHTYVRKPTIGSSITYSDICNDLDVKEYRRKINPEIYKYITTDWIDKHENANYNFEKQWDRIKGNINLTSKCGNYLTSKCGNDSLKDKVISKNQLTELIVKYLDNVEYLMHENHRKPQCFSDGYCDGTGIIIKNPNTQLFMDSKNNKLDESDIIEIYTDTDSYQWKEVAETSFSSSTTPTDLPTNLDNNLLNGIIEFNKTEWEALDVDIPLIINNIYKYNSKYYQYLGLLPRYITMGKIEPDKYIEITSDNIERVGQQSSSTNITKTLCTEEVKNRIDTNQIKLEGITQLTNDYYDNLLTNERGNIAKLKDDISKLNTDITPFYDDLCNKYNSDDYKLYNKYNLIKFIKNTSLATDNKIDLSGLVQKKIKLKKISENNITKKFNKQTGFISEEKEYECKGNECRNLGTIIGNRATLLEENITDDDNIIIISLNDFYRVVDKINILENDYLDLNTTIFKIFEINNYDISDKIDNDFLTENYPDIFTYTYNDFISINIDLHNIDISSEYYIIVDNNKLYDLNMDNTFKKFITNYKTNQQTTDIDLTNTEKCISDGLFANHDAISNSKNPCTGNFSCKENIFNKNYTKIQLQNVKSLDTKKNTWFNHITDYDDIYKKVVGYEVTSPVKTHANFWRNKYHNENQCPALGEGKSLKNDGLYFVDPSYNYGLKWKKLSPDFNIDDKTIISIYDDSILSLNSDEEIIDFTDNQNSIRFKNSEGDIISMSDITENYYLMITFKVLDSEINNYYEVYGSNKCSSSQICSLKSNDTYMDNFNEHVKNIYSDQEYCNYLNTKYIDSYSSPQVTSFEKKNEKQINDSGLESLEYYPYTYDNNYILYNFNS